MTKDQDYMALARERDDLRRMYDAGIAASAAQEREIQQLRGNLTLAEDGLASAMQEIERIHEVDRRKTREINLLVPEIKRLQAESDAWDKLSLVQLHKENERLRAALQSALNFAQHSSLCQRELSEASEEGTCAVLAPCTCGLQQLIDENRPPLLVTAAEPSEYHQGFCHRCGITHCLSGPQPIAAQESSAPRREAGDRAGPRISRPICDLGNTNGCPKAPGCGCYERNALKSGACGET